MGVAPADRQDPIYARPADRQVAEFFGGQNFLRGWVRGGQFHGALGALDLGGAAPEGPGLLTIRPEAIRPLPANMPPGTSASTSPASSPNSTPAWARSYAIFMRTLALPGLSSRYWV